jgi:hypothetical protein
VTGRTELVKAANVRKSVGLKLIGDLIAEGVISEKGRSLKLSAAPTREPEPRTLTFPGSPRFPRAGTAPEPKQEPELLPGTPPGSHSLKVVAPETGTVRLTRIHDGKRQELVPTQHGDFWRDSPAGAA